MAKKIWDDDELRCAVKQSNSIAQTMRRLGLTPLGGSRRTIKKRIGELNLDTRHFVVQEPGKMCSVAGCGVKHHANGFCVNHYGYK